jgi:hypothetical protein
MKGEIMETQSPEVICLFYTISELSCLLGIPVKTIANNLSRSPETLPPSLKVSNRRLFKRDDVHKWINGIPYDLLVA